MNLNKQVFQWNCNGIYDKYEEIKLIINQHHPDIICLQEIKTKPSQIINIKDYNTYRNNNINPNGQWGVAILIKNTISHILIIINTNLQAVACQVRLHGRQITVCSLYIQPSYNLTANDLNQLCNQLPRPFILMGDFNSHNRLWGSTNEDRWGRLVSDTIDQYDLVILNDGSPTFLSTSGRMTHIDLTLASQDISAIWSWRVEEDSRGSDHFPITLINNQNSPIQTRRPKFIEEKADWESFQNDVQLFSINLDQPVSDIVGKMNDKIMNSASRNIPKTSENPTRKLVPWWSKEIAEARKKRKSALRVFKRHPTRENLIAFRICRGKAKYLTKKGKKESWDDFRRNIGPSISSRDLWRQIRCLTHTNPQLTVSKIRVNGTDVIEPVEIANTLGESFAANSATSNYNASLVLRKSYFEANVQLNDNAGDCDLNCTFNNFELCSSINGKGKSAGPNGITYGMIKHLNPGDKKQLLMIFNRIWTTRTFPKQWRLSNVVPIPKKSSSILAAEFRPISLTNVDCKVMERMVNNRLVWYLEKNGKLSTHQYGFRRNRSTMDNMQVLEDAVLRAFNQKSHITCIFLDLEKAYERVWRYRILKQLLDWGVEGNIIHFIWNFLNEREFKVIIGNTQSENFVQENGVPQGSILSVTLFLVAIDSIKNIFHGSPVQFMLYADDLTIYIEDTVVMNQTRYLQIMFNRLTRWATECGFKFSERKTTLMHFCKKPSCPPINITMNGTTLLQSTSQTFLGLKIDKKWTWTQHITDLKINCKKNMNAMKCLKGIHKGSSRETLLCVLRSLIVSKLNYGCQFYGSATKSHLEKLEPVLNDALRIATGAFTTSPVVSLQAEAGILTLAKQRDIQTVQHFIKQKSITNSITNSQFSTHNKSFTRRALDIANLHDIPTDIFKFSPQNIQPQHKFSKLQILKTFHKYLKPITSTAAFRQEFLALKEKESNKNFFYTDGSKKDGKTGFAVVKNNEVLLSKRTPDHCSIFTVEAFAILEAIHSIEEEDNTTNNIVFTDSASTVEALTNPKTRNPIIRELQRALIETDKDIQICWIPGHAGIIGNEMADASAKQAAEQTEISATINTPSDVKSLIIKAFNDQATRQWTTLTTHLNQIKPTPSQWTTSNLVNRRDSTVLCRLRIGHTNLTHIHRIFKTSPPICGKCHQMSPLTVEHLILRCNTFNRERQKHNIPSTLKEALADDHNVIQRVINFLKEINVYNKI